MRITLSKYKRQLLILYLFYQFKPEFLIYKFRLAKLITYSRKISDKEVPILPFIPTSNGLAYFIEKLRCVLVHHLFVSFFVFFKKKIIKLSRSLRSYPTSNRANHNDN